MKTLDLKKICIDTFEKIEELEPVTDTEEQDILRCWYFLKNIFELKTCSELPGLLDFKDQSDCFGDTNLCDYAHEHLEMRECVCIRAILDHKKTKRKAGNKEFYIFEFNEVYFYKFREFMIKRLHHRDAVYNFFYNIYKVDYIKGLNNTRILRAKMLGRGENVSSTNLLAIDLDAYDFDGYKEIRKTFLDKGIIPVEVASGHGFHILIKIEVCTDKKLLAKWLKVMESCGINVDQHCKDPGRIYRLPYFFNIKSKKYNTVVKSVVIEGEKGVPTYTVQDIFEKFGFDYDNWDATYGEPPEQEASTVKVTEQKTERYSHDRSKWCQMSIVLNDDDLVNLYPMLDINILSDGIKKMLMGFVEGYTYYQLMCLVLFFKRMRLDIYAIKEIITITESLNGNGWNTWDTLSVTENFYQNIYGMSADELNTLQTEFGEILLPAYDNALKVPLGIMKPAELKMYLFILFHGECRKIDIQEGIKYSKNKIDRVLANASLIIKDKLTYRIMDKRVEHYVYVSKEELEVFLQWDANEIAVYLYLKFRCGEKENITTSIDAIEKDVLISNPTITKALQSLENKDIISVERKQFHHSPSLRESNTYTLMDIF